MRSELNASRLHTVSPKRMGTNRGPRDMGRPHGAMPRARTGAQGKVEYMCVDV